MRPNQNVPKVTFSSVMKTLGEEIAETSDGRTY